MRWDQARKRKISTLGSRGQSTQGSQSDLRVGVSMVSEHMKNKHRGKAGTSGVRPPNPERIRRTVRMVRSKWA